MDQGTVNLIIGVLGPLSGITVAWLALRGTNRKTTVDSTVAEKAVIVDEKQAHNEEISVIIEGFTQSLNNMRIDLGETRAELASTKVELASTRDELHDTRDAHNLLREEHVALRLKVELEKAEMLEHLALVEAMVPNPPGIPVRPAILRRL